jgi:para-aminobenzoate synthetase component 2
VILVIDNYDSFVHNVARYCTLLGETTIVVRNDALGLDDIVRMRPDAIVVSPGPCTPDEAGVSKLVIERLSGVIPILGVCLGHQCIGVVHGGRIARAKHPMHGLASDIRHSGARLFEGLPSPLPVGRYHSLIVEATGEMEAALTVDALSSEGEIMALSHRRHPTYGVQFHPESVLTPSGLALLGTFLSRAAAWRQRSATHALA